MNPYIEKLMTRYLSDELPEEETQLLMQWVSASQENANLFAKASLQHELVGELFEELDASEFVQPRNTTNPSSSKKKISRGLMAAAALLLLFLGLASWLRTEEEPPPHFAVITQSIGARFSDGSGVSVNQEIGQEAVEIARGLIRLDFNHGASMTVEGPARFRIQDAMHVYFEEGVATFHVPESVKGFTVDTIDAEIVDLGTAFGLTRKSGKTTNVSVFEGAVKVEGRLLRAGEAVSVSQGDGLTDHSFETTVFEKTWPVTSGVLQTTGMMQFVSPEPDFVPGTFEDDQHITVFLEQRDVRISNDLEVDLADPGEYRKIRQQEAPRIPAGTVLSSYLLQLDPVGQFEKGNENKPRVEGQITFVEPIVGLIASGRKLLITDSSLGHPRGNYGNLPRGLEPPKKDPHLNNEGRDTLILAADQRTLILNFSAGSAVDQIRVLVASPHKLNPIK